MASFKEHCAFGFWKGSLIVGHGASKTREAMGQFGRITSMSDLPSKKILYGFIREAMRLNETGVKSSTRAKAKSRSKPEAKVPAALASGAEEKQESTHRVQGVPPKPSPRVRRVDHRREGRRHAEAPARNDDRVARGRKVQKLEIGAGEMNWVPIATLRSGIEAELVVQQLEAEGIVAIARGNDGAGIFGPGFQGVTPRGVDVLVPSDAVDAARDVIDGVSGDEEDPDVCELAGAGNRVTTESVMLRHLFWASVILCALTGLAHTAIGLLSFEPLSPNLAWYLDAGMAMLLVALTNSAAWHPVRHASRPVRWLTHAGNFLMSLFGIVAAAATQEPRMYIGLVAMVGLFVTGMALDRAVTTTAKGGATIVP